jgi:uncharacterized protein (TIRG00374 family)
MAVIEAPAPTPAPALAATHRGQGRPAPHTGRRRTMAQIGLRAAASGALLALIFWRFGTAEVLATLRGADAGWIALSAALVVLALWVSAWKWGVLLCAHGLCVPVRRLFGSYLIGLFFNNFLPSNIGGDVVRVHDVGRITGRPAVAAASVIGERLLAGLALALTAAGALLFNATASRQVGGSVALVLAVFAGLSALVASSRVRARAGRLVPWLRGSVVGRVAGHMGEAFGDRQAVAKVLALSFAFQAVVVLVGWTTLLAVGAPVTLAACFAFIPIISALQLVPISLNGLGVREGAYVFFFGTIGVAAGQAVAASLLFGLVVTAVSLAGGVLFVARR